MRRSLFPILVLVLLWSRATAPQPTVFTDVKVRFNRSEKDRRLVDKVAVLVFDSAARKLVVNSPESPERSLNIPYDTIQDIHFEITTHMRGGVLAELIGAAAAVSVGVPEAGVPLSSKKVNDYWCYIEYLDSSSRIRNQMLEIGKNSSDRVFETMVQTFGDRVKKVEFAEQAEPIEKSSIADLQSKHQIKVD